MIQHVFISVLGIRSDIEELKHSAGMENAIVDMPGGSTIDGEFISGTKEYSEAEATIKRYNLDTFRRTWFIPTVKEICDAALLELEGYWLDDMYEVINKPDYTGVEACRYCGKGSLETHAPLSGKLTEIKGLDLVRLPPGLVLASNRLKDLFDEHQWTGAEFRPVIDSATDQESEEFFQLWITSTLPPMHATAPIEANRFPDACVYCKRFGYRLDKPQPVYADKVLEVAEDWNLSHEWLAPHAVSVPHLICKQRVAQEMKKLENETDWMPCLLVD